MLSHAYSRSSEKQAAIIAMRARASTIE